MIEVATIDSVAADLDMVAVDLDTIAVEVSTSPTMPMVALAEISEPSTGDKKRFQNLKKIFTKKTIK